MRLVRIETKQDSLILEAEVAQAAVTAKELIATLPKELRPEDYPKPLERAGLEDTKPNKPKMSDWDYDWYDSGGNPPPWGDWGDGETDPR